MPEFLVPKAKQLTTQQANISRRCTLVRWVVEASNAALKRWKFLSRLIRWPSIPHLTQDTQIAAALQNAYDSRLSADNDDVNVAQRFLRDLNKPNILQALSARLFKVTVPFDDLRQANIEGFPSLNPFDFKQISWSYQLKMAKSYIGEHLYGLERRDKQRKFMVAQESLPPDYWASKNIEVEDPLLLRGGLKSRHTGAKDYGMLILVDQSKRGHEAILAWYCQCKNGARTVDMCAHLLSITWWLGYGKHEYISPNPSEFLNRYLPLGIPAGDSDDEIDADDIEEDGDEIPPAHDPEDDLDVHVFD